MLYHLPAVAFTVFGLLLWCWKWTRRSISNLPGPPPGSWLTGNLPSIERSDDAAGAPLEWTKKYGTAFRVKGCFGENILYLSDPKAMQYILNTSGYNFPKTWERRVRGSLATGRGIAFSEGEQHARHRRIMNPSFSHSALKGFLPLFFTLSRKTVATWTTMIDRQNAEASILDVLTLLGRTTLDAIGEAAFGYKFNSIESLEPTTELQKAYQNILVDVNYMVSDFEIAFRRLLGYAPLWVTNVLIALPKKDLRRLRACVSIAQNVAKDLVEKEKQARARGKEGGKDVMSIFLKANNAENPKRRLEEHEILPQITTLLFAGHETTANSLSWALYELSKHPEVQQKLRDEVRATRADVASRGETEITISDLDSMQYMIAVMKETMRYHPIIVHLSRRAGSDDVIPLDNPQKTVSGNTITAIPVRKGQIVQLGFASYSRLESIWGQDADEWRPERFLKELPNESRKTGLGVFSNLPTFSSGLRSCIGWRFAMIEMQAVLFELIDHFDFSPAPNVEMRRAASAIMQCMVKGQEGKGTQMPLTVSIVKRHNAD